MSFFFFNDTATTEIYTLSLHDALPISQQLLLALVQVDRSFDGNLDIHVAARWAAQDGHAFPLQPELLARLRTDRKSTRLNSSHANISYAVFCLKKKKKDKANYTSTNST